MARADRAQNSLMCKVSYCFRHAFMFWLAFFTLNADISHLALLFAKQNKPLCNWDTKTQSAMSLLCLRLIWTPLLCLLHLVMDVFRLALFCVQTSISFFAQAGKKRGSNLFVSCLTVFHPIINVIFKENICWNKLAADQCEQFLHKPNRLMRAPHNPHHHNKECFSFVG